MSEPVVDILMYHAIDPRPGPTRIPPAAFSDQMAVLAESGVPVISLDDLVAARRGGAELAPRSVVVSFDDATEDFAEIAWPVMKRHGIRPINFVPTGYVGQTASWPEAGEPAPRVMGWDMLAALSEEGVRFGSHTRSHPVLTRMSDDEVRDELRASKETLEDRLGVSIAHFAPPFGVADRRTLSLIGEVYDSSAGTTLGTVTPRSDLMDLPRLEMHYYQSRARWNDHLQGRGQAYFALRRFLRGVRLFALSPWALR